MEYDTDQETFLLILKPFEENEDWKMKKKMKWVNRYGIEEEKSCYFLFDFQVYQFRKLETNLTHFSIVQGFILFLNFL
jgi:hypothetical protein